MGLLCHTHGHSRRLWETSGTSGPFTCDSAATLVETHVDSNAIFGLLRHSMTNLRETFGTVRDSQDFTQATKLDFRLTPTTQQTSFQTGGDSIGDIRDLAGDFGVRRTQVPDCMVFTQSGRLTTRHPRLGSTFNLLLNLTCIFLFMLFSSSFSIFDHEFMRNIS